MFNAAFAIHQRSRGSRAHELADNGSGGRLPTSRSRPPVNKQYVGTAIFLGCFQTLFDQSTHIGHDLFVGRSRVTPTITQVNFVGGRKTEPLPVQLPIAIFSLEPRAARFRRRCSGARLRHELPPVAHKGHTYVAPLWGTVVLVDGPLCGALGGREARMVLFGPEANLTDTRRDWQ